ncbi:hypothetical protein, partial [Caldisericum sp.]|uniref:hypothetical protein n=1 Tax=Caldisericum sp. TaxID=2499687 RepID=UPI003D1359F6
MKRILRNFRGHNTAPSILPSKNTPKNCQSEERSDEDSPIKWRRDTLPELHPYDGDSSWLRHFGMT